MKGNNATEPGDLLTSSRHHLRRGLNVWPTMGRLLKNIKYVGQFKKVHNDDIGICIASIHEPSLSFGGCYVVWSTCVGWCWDDLVEIDMRLKE